MAITPEWIVVVIAIGGIVYHVGYTYQTLNWLKDNAVTKKDLELLKLGNEKDMISKDACEKVHTQVGESLNYIQRDIAQLRVNIANSIVENRAAKAYE